MKYLLALLFGLVVLAGFSGTAHADTSNFYITTFSADYVLDNNVSGGSLETTETITLTFNDQNHGIFVYTPKSYKGFSTKLNVSEVKRDGQSEKFQTNTENGNTVIKIGNPDQTITGNHTYILRYHQERVINFDGPQPEFYWDVNGNGWAQTILGASAKVTFKGHSLSGSERSCYTGIARSTDKNCTVADQGDSVYFATTKPLAAHEGLTIAVSMPAGAFTKPSSKDKLADYSLSIVGVILALIGSVFAFRLWHKYGKDTGYKGVVVPEYEPPSDLKPAEVGMLADFSVDSRDLAATIIDLAVRKYIRLHENVSKFLGISRKSYSIELLGGDLSTLNGSEKSLLDGIFAGAKAGTVIEMNKLNKTTMYSAVQESRESIKKDLTDKYGLVETKFTKGFWYLAIALVVYGIAAFILKQIGFFVGLAIFAFSTVLAGMFMQRRTHTGVETYEKIMGLKMYMNVAEKDRLKMMQSVDRPYAEPSKTVDLFEKLLPYAVALGVEKSWAQQFDGILTERPDWISSNSVAAFSGANLASSITGVAGNFSSSFETSSGSSGGGSSGGGGGGGGGGGW